MRLVKSLAVFLHTLLFLVIGLGLLLMSLNLFTPEELAKSITTLYQEPNAKPIFGIVGGIFILIGLIMAHINITRLQREKTIAFENPDGQVTVSLSAIEDFIKKSVRHLAEVKELRSSVTANKRGINVGCRATIFADSNIPEVTERVQNIIKSRVKDMLGVEETINIKIDVTKITPKGEKGTDDYAPKESEETSRRMPFTGME